MESFQRFLENLGLYPGADALKSGLLSLAIAIALLLLFRAFTSWSLINRFTDRIPKFMRGLDNRFIAIGSRITGTYRFDVWRWPRFFLFFGACAVVAAFAPPPAMALSALAIGVLGIFCILRHWSRDEAKRRDGVIEDRGRFILIDPDRMPRSWTGGDLRAPAVGALLALLFLLPIGFARFGIQSHAWVPADWLNYSPLRNVFLVWSEIPHATPVLHHMPFLNRDENDASAIVTFALRVVIEIFLIASLMELLHINRDILENRDFRGIEKRLLGNSVEAQESAVDDLKRLISDLEPRALIFLKSVLTTQIAAPWYIEPDNLKYSAFVRRRVAALARDVGEERLDPSLMFEATVVLSALRAEFSRIEVPLQWATIRIEYGYALATFANWCRAYGVPGVEQAYEKAVEQYREALDILTSADNAWDWKITRFRLGNALKELGQMRGKEGLEHLEAAAGEYREALGVGDVPGHEDDYPDRSSIEFELERTQTLIAQLRQPATPTNS